MQFIANGPDIPDSLLQAHEEGRVVFFCGAGISYPAGLPGFKGLVDEIYRLAGTTRNLIEEDAYNRDQFDATLDLLERRLPGQRLAVRMALLNALQPNLRRKGATDTHAAILQLARNREGSVRLVTTNFDRIFLRVAKLTKQTVDEYRAPMLPIPKNSRWNGLVYLHGILPEGKDESALHRLVLTSGDFGLAYLTERWAARFVSELFRNYVVCFVGYSINDPVLRYMMDALAADRMLGEVTPQAYALGDCESGQEYVKTIEWEAKGVVPILYEVPAGTDDHSVLHRTLKSWAETYRDGILGKERIVVECAMARPSDSTKQDDFVGRMLWALSHKSGLPAKCFADHNPVPSLEWLQAFSKDCYKHNDLGRFGVPPHVEENTKLKFSLLLRPAPYTHAPWMSLVSGGDIESQWDDVMFQLARWLVRHLNDPDLIIWLAQQGGQLHNRLPWLIEHELNRVAQLEREAKVAELEEIRTNAPNAIPQPLMRILWRLLLTDRVKSPWRDLDLYRWKDRLTHDGLTTMLRLELRELLKPKITIKKPFHWGGDQENGPPARLGQLVDWELQLATDHVHSFFEELQEAELWTSALPLLLDDFQQLLRDALDLFVELEGANEREDRSYWDLPSISPHWQNRGFQDWVTIIELLRDSWSAIRDKDPVLASSIARGWFSLPYPTFKRLALFAATHDNCISPDTWVVWLLADHSWWLWSVVTQRETMRLLVLQGGKMSPEAQVRLEAAILAGPPRAMYKDDLEAEYWQDLVERSVWLHLSKLNASGIALGSEASRRLAALSTANPLWQLSANEKDEFSHWMSGTGDPDFAETKKLDIAPRNRHGLVQWLKQPSSGRSPFYEDTWRHTCLTRFYHSMFALCDLSQQGVWPMDRWREALQAWSDEGHVFRSWRFGAPVVNTMPDCVLQEVLNTVTWWLEKASKSVDRHESILLNMCNRVLGQSLETSSGIYRNGKPIDQPVTEAINHPVGHVTQALLNLWFKGEPNDNDKLPVEIARFFTKICDTGVEHFRHGRVLLASRLISLFRVDQAWTQEYLLPLFDWNKCPAEAKAVWEGFLWSPRLYRPLLLAYKSQLLDTVSHYAELGEHGRQFAALLTYAALDPVDSYTTKEFQTAIGALPQSGLKESAQALVRALEGAGEQREDNWKNRIQPFWHHIWPKSRELASTGIAESVARLSIAARGEFPSALSAVLDWLQPIEHPHYVVHLLAQSDLSRRFPGDALRLLNAVINDQPWAPRDLTKCLHAISQAEPALERDHRYLRLVDYSRLHGIG